MDKAIEWKSTISQTSSANFIFFNVNKSTLSCKLRYSKNIKTIYLSIVYQKCVPQLQDEVPLSMPFCKRIIPIPSNKKTKKTKKKAGKL